MDYVHGYDKAAGQRLGDQADALTRLLHDGTRYRADDHVLEVGCGVGSQTRILLKNNPGTRFTCVDQSESSITTAKQCLREFDSRLQFALGDARSLEYGDATFDHVFICFVLEHVARPLDVLAEVKRVLRPGGTVTVIEGDHGSVIMSPPSAAADAAIDCLVTLQRISGADAMIGRRLYPLLGEANFSDVVVQPRQVYADGADNELRNSFTRKTFTAMIEGVRDAAIANGIISPDAFDNGISALNDAADGDGVFAYTFFKAVGHAPVDPTTLALAGSV